MTLGSLFDGIGGWLLAARHAGVMPAWASEIEAFPYAVTAHHFPDVTQMGDITKIDGAAIPPVDIVCAGSPCQGLSLAGKRRGLDDERSGLFHRAIDIVRAMRRATGGRHPRFFVWENVLGAFNSNKGMDFRAVLEEIGQIEIPMPQNGKWATAGMAELPQCEIAWRVLDAKYWGVPQRRRRIFLVADFAADGRCAGEILFEREGMYGHLEKSEGARQGTARGTESGTRTEKAYTLNTVDRHAVADISGAKSFSEYEKGQVATLKAAGGSEDLKLSHSIVCRLTPMECERLQGLLDGYTAGGSDTARYKALGNGMAQPCADYVIRRIIEVAADAQRDRIAAG